MAIKDVFALVIEERSNSDCFVVRTGGDVTF